ncbi:MAG TPA: glycosyltransferase [Gammaproteobacteria bacterium]|nr:glycosyltransferase [Gammaproteobacteria bacterium]
MTALIAVCMFALLAWVGVLVAPHQPHRTRERLEADPTAEDDCASVTVLIPARDEATSIGRAIGGLAAQGRGLDVIVVDDESSDGTAEAARAAATAARGALELRVIAGRPLPEGWAGKPWALEQGLAAVDRPFVLLLDADIEVARGLVSTLLREARARDASLVSLLAELHCTGFWERLLTPAFVFFFKLLYPFVWSNDPRRRTAAAAGGCMLVRSDALRAIGGFAAIRGALIDDCTLAAALKRTRPPIWLGMTHSVRSLREYLELGDFWSMVSRSAFTQLKYSTACLLLAIVLMVATLIAPAIGTIVAAATGDFTLAALALAGWLAMAAAYSPLVRFYRLPLVWALTLPGAGALFLAMTVSSAVGYWRGTRASWKARAYGRSP